MGLAAPPGPDLQVPHGEVCGEAARAPVLPRQASPGGGGASETSPSSSWAEPRVVSSSGGSCSLLFSWNFRGLISCRGGGRALESGGEGGGAPLVPRTGSGPT